MVRRTEREACKAPRKGVSMLSEDIVEDHKSIVHNVSTAILRMLAPRDT